MTADHAAARETAELVSPSDGPRGATAWAALVYAVATLALGWHALGGKFLVGPDSDQYIAGYAFREYAAATLRATHAFPLWNPYQFGGMPYVAAMHGDIFYPTFLLRMVLPTDVAMTWGFMIHVFLAGLFTYIFMRRARFGFAAALIGGVAYMMSGHIATYVNPGHDGKLFVAALFPLLLWAIVAWVRDGRMWGVGAIALIVGLDVLAPHPQLLQYSLLAAGAYAIVLAVGLVRDEEANSRAAITRLVVALGAVVLGLCIGAVQYLPVREYVAWSPRASGIGTYARATSYGKNPQEIFNAYLPEFTGILDRYWGPNRIHLQGDYVGVVVLMLAGAGLVGLRRDPRSRELWFWLATVIVALLWALGAHTPFYNIPFYLVPGTRYFRAPDSVFFVGTLGIAIFAARGTERALRWEISRRYVAGWCVFGVAVLLLGAFGILTDIAHTVAPQGTEDLVDANAANVITGALRALIFVVATAAFITQGRRLPRVLFGFGQLAVLAFLMLADLWSVNEQYWVFSPPAKVLYASNPAIDYLAHLPQPARVVTLQLADNASYADYDGAGLMVHGVLNTLGYHGNELARYNTLLQIPQGSGPTPESRKVAIASPNVRRITATNYVLTNTAMFGQALQGAVQVAGPPTEDSTGMSDYVFKIPGDAPFAWVAPVIVKAGDDAAFNTVVNPQFDVDRAAIFDTSAHVAAVADIKALPPATGIAVHVDSYAPGRIRLSLDRPAPAGSALIVAENYYPGWHATVDGKAAEIGRAQFVSIGVPLSAGARAVALDFSSSAYETGKVVTWIAIFCSVLVLVGGAVAERRRRA